jgi:DNA-binding CsgD family transcriptional regulator
MRLQLFQDLSEAADRETFERRLLALANEMEFDLVTGLFVTEIPGAPAHVVPLGNRPAAFAELSSSDSDSARDPLVKRLQKLSVPMVYDQSLYVEAGAADLWEQQAQFGYRTGIAVALHLPGGKHLVLGLNRAAPLPQSEERLIRMLSELQFMAVHAQQPALRLFGQTVDVALTPREQSILRKVIEGKTTKVIAQELFCAEVTVNFHVQHSSRKLGTNSRHQAAQKARALGLI